AIEQLAIGFADLSSHAALGNAIRERHGRLLKDRSDLLKRQIGERLIPVGGELGGVRLKHEPHFLSHIAIDVLWCVSLDQIEAPGGILVETEQGQMLNAAACAVEGDG